MDGDGSPSRKGRRSKTASPKSSGRRSRAGTPGTPANSRSPGRRASLADEFLNMQGAIAAMRAQLQNLAGTAENGGKEQTPSCKFYKVQIICSFLLSKSFGCISPVQVI